MRKALIGMVMAATMLTPVAAEAQRGRGGGDRDRGQRAEQSESGEARAARIEERNERRAARQAQRQPQPQAQAPQPAPQAQAQAQVQVAQRRGGGDANRGSRGDRGNRGDRGGQPSIYPQAWQGDPNSPDLRRYQRLEAQNQRRGAGRDDRRDDRRDWRGDRRDDRRDWRDDRRGDRGDWNRGWRNDRRYDWNNWRGRNRNIFRLSPYYSPYRNHRYSRFSIGFFLQPLFFSQRFWIGDPWQYRLPPAPYGTQWVRYYGDVLLVDVYSGEVIDVIYDFFW